MKTEQFVTTNPYTGEKVAGFSYATDLEIETTLQKAYSVWKDFSQTTVSERKQLLIKIAQALKIDSQKLATIMSLEMGKPIKDAFQEIDKCVSACEYLAEHGEKWLETQKLSGQYKQTSIQKESIGPVLAIMPWNYPAWQVMRALAPQILIGNPVILKHADLVAGFSEALVFSISHAMEEKPLLQNLHFDHAHTEKIIADHRIRGVTFTGSVKAGSTIAMLAGQYLKKTVLELGGSDPYLVFKDADLDLAVKTLVRARLVNNGQSCIAAKRFIVAKEIKDEFVRKAIVEFQKYPHGDPANPATVRGPLASKRFQVELLDQVEALIEQGAKRIWSSEDCPTFDSTACCAIELLECPNDFQALRNVELFGPVACLQTFEHEFEAIHLANNSEFGLGAALFTQDELKARQIAAQLEAGMVAINALVISDVRTPFGGVKNSGFGRELGEQGFLEFVRFKTLGIA